MANTLTARAPGSVPTTAGLVLAGGASRRMGRNKALLEQRGVTLLQHMQTLLQRCGCEPVLISGEAVGGLPDRIGQAGPLAGIDAAMAALAPRTDIVQLLVVPVDMPALTPALLDALIAAGDGNQLVAFDGDSPLPLLLPNGDAVRRIVSERLAADEPRSLKALLAALPNSRLLRPADAVGAFDNLNTPTDWLQWQQRHEKGERR